MFVVLSHLKNYEFQQDKPFLLFVSIDKSLQEL